MNLCIMLQTAQTSTIKAENMVLKDLTGISINNDLLLMFSASILFTEFILVPVNSLKS